MKIANIHNRKEETTHQIPELQQADKTPRNGETSSACCLQPVYKQWGEDFIHILRWHLSAPDGGRLEQKLSDATFIYLVVKETVAF